MKRKICFFTGTRADFGLLKPIISEFQKLASQFEVQTIVTGTHLSVRFGETYKEIESSGVPISRRVEILGNDFSPTGILQNMGRAVSGLGQALAELQPDLVFILGDRYEALAMATAALHLNVPVAHLHGGEVSAGATDDNLRHAITKMSWLHFTATEKSKQRVVQMGESPERVFFVGATGVENAKNLKLKSLSELESTYQWKFRPKNILVTYHPETIVQSNPGAAQRAGATGAGIAENSSLKQWQKVLAALASVLADDPQVGLILTASNADAGGEAILKETESWVQQHPSVLFVKSFGVENYLSTLSIVDGVVGNSSSGIIEAPALETWTLNIGDRQKGRERASSIFDVECSEEKIKSKLQQLLTRQWQPSDFASPYAGAIASDAPSVKIRKIIEQWQKPSSLMKEFYDQV